MIYHNGSNNVVKVQFVFIFIFVPYFLNISKVKDSSFHGKDNEQKSEEYNALSTAFKSKFWINSITSDTHVEAEEKNVLSAYHPLILKFLRDKILTYETSSIQDKTTVNKVSSGGHLACVLDVLRI